MRITRLAITAALILAATTVAMAGSSNSMMGMSGGMKLTVTMHAQNGSNENGTARLWQTGKNLTVDIMLNNAPASAQPAHIHEGTCAKLNPAPKYPLANVVNGRSHTVVKGITIADLLKSKFAINVHKSAADIPTYVSCGDIKK